jgi:hypothetical protein
MSSSCERSDTETADLELNLNMGDCVQTLGNH